MKLRSEVFEILINTLNNYNYCILRNYETLPEYGNDIDILIDSSQLKGFEKELMNNFNNSKVILIRKNLYVCNSLYFFDLIDLSFIHIDLFNSHKFKILYFINSKDVLQSRKLYNGFYVPSEQY
jgi:hypothetical protein